MSISLFFKKATTTTEIKIEMKKTTDYERSIVLKVQSPAQFKFTKGSWDTELQVIGTYNNVTIKPEKNKEFEFEIVKNECRVGKGESHP